jgi:hypothetical protein
MTWAGHVARMGEKKTAYMLLVRMPEGKRPLGRTRHRWMDNIKMEFVEIGWCGVDCIDPFQGKYKWRVTVSAVINLRVPTNARKLSSGCTTGDVSSGAQLHRVSQSPASQHRGTPMKTGSINFKKILILIKYCKKGDTETLPTSGILACIHTAINVGVTLLGRCPVSFETNGQTTQNTLRLHSRINTLREGGGVTIL